MDDQGEVALTVEYDTQSGSVSVISTTGIAMKSGARST